MAELHISRPNPDSTSILPYAVTDINHTSPSESPATKLKNLFSRRQSKTVEQSSTTSSHPDSGYASLDSGSSQDKGKTSKLNYVNLPISQQQQDRFRDIRCLFADSLLDAVPGDASMKIRWVGLDEPSAQLCIVVQCCDKRAVRKAKKFFHQDHVREEVEKDFIIHVIPGLRRLNGGLKVFKKPGLNGGQLNGTMIRIEGQNKSKISTLGGLVSVKVKGITTLYGFTAGHSVPRRDASVDASSQDSRESDESDPEDSDTSSETSEVFNGDDTDSSNPAHTASVCSEQAEISKEIGYVTQHSFENCNNSRSNYDWALIHLLDSTYTSGGSPANINENSAPKGTQSRTLPLQVAQTNWTQYPNGVRVYAMTTRGQCHGLLVSNASCIRIAPGTEAVETLDFIPNPHTDECITRRPFMLRPGDSGSWVIREDTGEVFQDIQTKLGADEISIPSQQRWLSATESTQQATGVVAGTDPAQRLYESLWAPRAPGMETSHTPGLFLSGWYEPADQEQWANTLETFDYQIAMTSEPSTHTNSSHANGSNTTTESTVSTELSSHGSTYIRQPVSQFAVDKPSITDEYLVGIGTDEYHSDDASDSDFLGGFPTYTSSRAMSSLQDMEEAFNTASQPTWHFSSNPDEYDDQMATKVTIIGDSAFRGTHLRAERDRGDPVRKWKCIDPASQGLRASAPVILPLDKCRACVSGKQYSSHHSAAAHLRRIHFRDRSAHTKSGPATQDASKGDQLSMTDLKTWMKEIKVYPNAPEPMKSRDQDSGIGDMYSSA
ncbi:hypothetical protein PG991_014299 [Apiospora marii]|uniref:DUF7896 domain-containing protein n=1 Tax=Apiospora marii TaxID=335849 RepID=A0ABR1R8J0_9PEZI